MLRSHHQIITPELHADLCTGQTEALIGYAPIFCTVVLYCKVRDTVVEVVMLVLFESVPVQ
jgi:hypothetical protein